MKSKITYRQQFTRCGKQRCRKCKEGTGHGPYWYAYWSENGRTVSKYHMSKVIQPKIIISNTEPDRELPQLEEHAAQEVIEQATTALTSSKPSNEGKAISHVVPIFVGTSQLGRYNQSPLVGRARELDTMRQILYAIEVAAHGSQLASAGHEQSVNGTYPPDRELPGGAP